LGTGQLFVENYTALPLYVEGERLYFRSKLERFEREISRFRETWFDEKTSKVSMQTSGSTGVPQRIDVEKAAMRASAMRTLRALRLKEGDRALLCLPVAYVAGKMMLVRAWEGKLSLEIAPPSLHPFALLTEAPDFVALTPAQAAASYGVEAERRLMEKTRCILLGGGKVDAQLEAQLQSCRGEVWSSYGMTETLSVPAVFSACKLDRRTARTRAALRKALAEEIDATGDLTSVTVTGVTERAGLTRRPFFSPSKKNPHNLGKKKNGGSRRRRRSCSQVQDHRRLASGPRHCRKGWLHQVSHPGRKNLSHGVASHLEILQPHGLLQC